MRVWDAWHAISLYVTELSYCLHCSHFEWTSRSFILDIEKLPALPHHGKGNKVTISIRTMLTVADFIRDLSIFEVALNRFANINDVYV